MKSFKELMTAVTKNVDYWAWYVSSKTSLEKEDIYQELLLIIWKEYCSRIEKGKPTTKYFMQKRLYYASIRMMRNFYHSMASITSQLPSLNYTHYETKDDIMDERIENSKIKEWLSSVFDDLSNTMLKDSRVKMIFSMLRQGYKNFEIAKALDMKENTLSLIITRNIKKPLKEIVEENPFLDVVNCSEYVEVYS